MLRDKLKSTEYFDSKINKLQGYIKEDTEEIKQGLIKKSQISDVSRGCFDFSLRVLFSMYSAGYSKEKIEQYYLEAVDLMPDEHNNWLRYFEGNIPGYIFQKFLTMLSFAVLFDVSEEIVDKLRRVIDVAPNRYKVLDYYIAYLDKTRKVGKEQKSELVYKDLNAIIDLSNDVILANNLMGKYLKNWYNKEDRVYLHDTHNTGLDNYVGYWSFESAALVKIKGLDDSAFKDESPYYPKDLL